jgi:hypothetical protein
MEWHEGICSGIVDEDVDRAKTFCDLGGDQPSSCELGTSDMPPSPDVLILT